MSGTCRLAVGYRAAVPGEPFYVLFYKAKTVKNAPLWNLRSGGRVKNMNSAGISAQIEKRYSL